MFKYSLDNKPQIVDDMGNTIVDLASSMFSKRVSAISTYTLKHMASHAEMRPDIVSLAEYDTPDGTEYILKYSGISNPFTLSEDDVLLIPNYLEAYAQMVANTPDTVVDKPTDDSQSIKNYFKFVNQDYKKDKSSYDALAKKEIKSASLEGTTFSGDFYVPYISQDNKTAITIKNGRVFFGGDSGMLTNEVISAATTNLDEKILKIIDSTNTVLSDSNCMYNGTTLADFVRAAMKNTI